jgi:hypothetical protein
VPRPPVPTHRSCVASVTRRPPLLVAAVLILAGIACALVPAEPTESTELLPTPTVTLEPDPTVAAAVIYRDSVFEFIGLDGERLERRSAEGMDDPQPRTVQVVGASVYYLDGGQHVVRRVSSKDSQTLDFTSRVGLSSFLISPNREHIAWVVSEFADSITSELWISDLNGGNPLLVERTDPARTERTAHILEPYRWTADGDLVYSWQPIGLGGYTLYGGYASFYRFSPAAKRTTSILPLTTISPGACWNSLSQDLTLAVGTCGADPGAITMRILTLGTGSEVVVPVVADQGTAGAAEFSPDGQRLAYAVARNDPEAEAGQVLLVDMAPGSQPIPLASLSDGHFRRLDWLDDDRLVVGESAGGEDRVVLLTLGAAEVPLGAGQLVGLQIP